MKTGFLFTILTLLLAGACRSDESIGPADLLYKRWNPFQTKRIGETNWVQYDTDAYYDTEYRLDSTLIYRRNGIIVPTPCCSGSRFARKGVIIQYADFPSCPLVKCASTNQVTITILKADLLELQNGDQLTQYVPAR